MDVSLQQFAEAQETPEELRLVLLICCTSDRIHHMMLPCSLQLVACSLVSLSVLQQLEHDHV